MPNILSIITQEGFTMNITLIDILNRIEQADDFEINEIMAAVRRRYQILFPDWEVLYLSCPKNDPDARKQMLDFLIRHPLS